MVCRVSRSGTSTSTYPTSPGQFRAILLEVSPPDPLERTSDDEPDWSFTARIRVGLNAAQELVQAALPKRPEGEAAWGLATLPGGNALDAYALGRFRGDDADVFLVLDDDDTPQHSAGLP